MKKIVIASAIVFAAAGNAAFAGNSTFQLTCSEISYFYSGAAPAVKAACLRADGTSDRSSLVIKGIANQNGNLVNSGGASSFQKSCGNIQINVTTNGATLSAFCRTTSGSFNNTSIPLDGISNNNGNLTY